jgi:hypothetical protein
MSRLSEAQFQEQVLHIAELYGWLPYHKAPNGKVRPEQRQWIAHLLDVSVEVENVLAQNAAAGGNSSLAVEVYLWHPDDFDDIVARLSRGRARRRAAA